MLGLSGTLAGLALAIALVFDALSDPLAGTLSDRWQSSWGRRHPFMYASALPLAFAFYGTFSPPDGLGQDALFAWLLTFAILTRASMTLYHVPHMALGAELSDGYHERTRIVHSRALWQQFGAGAIGGFGLLWFMRATPQFSDGRFNPGAYPAMAATFAVVMAVTILASAWRTHHRIPYLKPSDRVEGGHGNLLHDAVRGVGDTLRLRSFRSLFFGSTLIFAAVGVTGTLSLHNGTYFWKIDTTEMFWVGAAGATGLILGLGFWTAVAERLDKKPTFLTGLAIFGVAVTLPLVLKVAGLWPARASGGYLFWLGLSGFVYSFGIASTMVTGGSMMADVTDEDELRHARRREGLFFGAVAFTAKANVGLGSLVAGVLVDLVGLEPWMTMENVPDGVAVQLGIVTALTLAILVFASGVAFSRYDLSRARHAEIRAALDVRGGAGVDRDA